MNNSLVILYFCNFIVNNGAIEDVRIIYAESILEINTNYSY